MISIVRILPLLYVPNGTKFVVDQMANIVSVTVLIILLCTCTEVAHFAIASFDNMKDIGGRMA